MSIQFIDKTGEIITEIAEFSKAFSFSEGLCGVGTEKGLYGFVDKHGATIIEPKFFSASSFCEGLSAVKTKEKGFLFQPVDKWGFIDKKGNVVFESDFDTLYNFSDNIAVATKGDRIIFMNKSWQETISFNANEISFRYSKNSKFSEGLIAAFDIKTKNTDS